MNANLDNVTSLEAKARRNITFLGLDVNSPVFFISSGLAIIFSCLVLAYPEASNQLLSDTRNFVVARFDTLFTVSMSAFTLIIFFLIISPFGKIRLGGKDSTPEFGFLSWVCMLFAAGVGIGLSLIHISEPTRPY